MQALRIISGHRPLALIPQGADQVIEEKEIGAATRDRAASADGIIVSTERRAEPMHCIAVICDATIGKIMRCSLHAYKPRTGPANMNS